MRSRVAYNNHPKSMIDAPVSRKPAVQYAGARPSVLTVPPCEKGHVAAPLDSVAAWPGSIAQRASAAALRAVTNTVRSGVFGVQRTAVWVASSQLITYECTATRHHRAVLPPMSHAARSMTFVASGCAQSRSSPGSPSQGCRKGRDVPRERVDRVMPGSRQRCQ